MTQPDIINWDDFPEREVDPLTEVADALRELTQELREQRLAGAREVVADTGLAGDFTLPGDPNIEHVEPTQENLEVFWGEPEVPTIEGVGQALRELARFRRDPLGREA